MINFLLRWWDAATATPPVEPPSALNGGGSSGRAKRRVIKPPSQVVKSTADRVTEAEIRDRIRIVEARLEDQTRRYQEALDQFLEFLDELRTVSLIEEQQRTEEIKREIDEAWEAVEQQQAQLDFLDEVEYYLVERRKKRITQMNNFIRNLPRL